MHLLVRRERDLLSAEHAGGPVEDIGGDGRLGEWKEEGEERKTHAGDGSGRWDVMEDG